MLHRLSGSQLAGCQKVVPLRLLASSSSNCRFPSIQPWLVITGRWKELPCMIWQHCTRKSDIVDQHSGMTSSQSRPWHAEAGKLTGIGPPKARTKDLYDTHTHHHTATTAGTEIAWHVLLNDA